MRSRRLLILATSSLLCASVSLDCSSDDTDVDTSGGPDAMSDATSPNDATTSDSAAADSNTADSGGADAGASDASSDVSAEASVDAAMYCSLFDGGQPAILLAQGLDKPTSLAVDGTDFYVGTSSQVLRCPLSGCPDAGPTTIASASSVWGLRLSATTVFFSEFFGGVKSCPKSGCGDAGPTVFPATSAAGIAIDDANLYWTEFTPGRVASCPQSGCTDASVIYKGASGPTYGVEVDSTYVYFSNNSQGKVFRAPLGGVPDGGAPELLAKATNPAYMAKSKDQIFVTNQADPGAVYVLPRAGNPDGGAASAFASSLVHARTVAVDEVCQNVFFAALGRDNTPVSTDGGALFRCPLAGCPDAGPEVIAKNQPGAWSVVVDDQYVYWANYDEGTVWKRAK